MSSELMPEHLTKTLNQVRNELMADFSDADRASYRYLVDGIVKLKDSAPASRPPFSLMLPASMRSHSTPAWLRFSVRGDGLQRSRRSEAARDVSPLQA
jgi:hypothetical protein